MSSNSVSVHLHPKHPHSSSTSKPTHPYMSTSSSTTASLVSSYESESGKNYAAAFATLHSTYGLGGQTPSVFSMKKSLKAATPSAAVPTPAGSAQAPKDYESPFGSLSSAFGFCGAAPAVQRKPA
ncbi:hypothetical protein C8J57DRAFT_289457 [Mycena rebaudengoi]|nr:hypothetical protein C8J57DRAFT_289457 [Mycena rebaudengoi]